MSDILCITNRMLCKDDFLTRIEKLAAARPMGIVLREKDMTEEQYRDLAVKVMRICKKYKTRCILHTFLNVANDLGATAVHLPMKVLMQTAEEEISHFSFLGASCHSVEDAITAEKKGCNYITAGHIFNTDCKKGMPGRGIEFLTEVCKSVSIPVYAIGGISKDNIRDVRTAGAAGACVMSGPMICEDVKEYLSGFEVEIGLEIGLEIEVKI